MISSTELKLDIRFLFDPLAFLRGRTTRKHVMASICPLMPVSSGKAVKDTPTGLPHVFTKAANYEQNCEYRHQRETFVISWINDRSCQNWIKRLCHSLCYAVYLFWDCVEWKYCRMVGFTSKHLRYKSRHSQNSTKHGSHLTTACWRAQPQTFKVIFY